MSIVHIPFYPSDWLSGTRGLSDAETGVYITLIARMYEMAGPIDRDDDRLTRLCGSKSKAGFKKALDYLIDEGKITFSNGMIFNDRVEKVIKNVTEKSTKAKDAAEARWDKKTNKNKDCDDADALQTHSERICHPKPKPNNNTPSFHSGVASQHVEDGKSESKTEPEKPPPKPKQNTGKRLPEDWQPNDDDYNFAAKEGMDHETITRTALKFRDYWFGAAGAKGRKLDWSATWRNWVRADIDRKHSNQSRSVAGKNNQFEQGMRIADYYKDRSRSASGQN